MLLSVCDDCLMEICKFLTLIELIPLVHTHPEFHRIIKWTIDQWYTKYGNKIYYLPYIQDCSLSKCKNIFFQEVVNPLYVSVFGKKFDNNFVRDISSNIIQYDYHDPFIERSIVVKDDIEDNYSEMYRILYYLSTLLCVGNKIHFVIGIDKYVYEGYGYESTSMVLVVSSNLDDALNIDDKIYQGVNSEYKVCSMSQ